MGLSSSQARLLHLTSRMHQIEYKAAKLEAEKLRMANESEKAYDEYLNALESTKVQYKFLQQDGSIGYNDASYFSLCMYDGGASEQFALLNPDTDEIYLTQTVKNAYEQSADASDFALRMSGLTEVPTPPTPTPPPVNPTPTPTPTPDPDPNPGVTPTPPPTPTPDPEPTPDPADKTLNMGSTITFAAGTDPITVTLADGFNAGNKYVISSQNGNPQVTMKYLNNGRLQITANNCTIEEEHAQADDLILIGDGNTVSTGSMDDIVRVGGAMGFLTSSYQSDNNTINTGAGNDHVTLYGVGTQVDLGAGSDSINYLADGVDDYTTTTGAETEFGQVTNPTSYDYNIGAATQGSMGDCRFLALLSSFENIRNYVNISGDEANGWDVTFKNYTGTPNSVHVTKATLESSWVRPNWQDATTSSYGTGAGGDLDVRLTEYALNKLIYDSTGYSLKSTSYQQYSRYLLGTDDVSIYLSSRNSGGYGDYSINGTGIVTCDASSDITQSLVQNLFNRYQNGSISNLTCGLQTGNDSVHAAGSHAYAIKAMDANSITLINPWDNQDELQLKWSDFLNMVNTLVVYGDASHEPNGEVYNSSVKGTSTTVESVEESSVQNLDITMSSTTEDTPVDDSSIQDLDVLMTNALQNVSLNIFATTQEVVVNAATPGEINKYNYYINLYNLIQSSNGIIAVPDDMRASVEYLINVINGGFGYLKTFDEDANEWIDTSVAINTSLREVDNEKELKKAEAKYEADMLKIDRKDRRYDQELAALDAERNAVKSEMDTLKKVAKENVDRTFKLFS